MKASESRPRRPWMAALLSAVVFPGAGQVYNRQVAKGIALIALTVVGSLAFTVIVFRIVSAAVTANPDFDPSQTHQMVEQAVHSGAAGLSITLWGLTIVWVWSIVDAYLVARRSALAAADTMPR